MIKNTAAKTFLTNAVLRLINQGYNISKFFTPQMNQQVVKRLRAHTAGSALFDQRLAYSIGSAWVELTPENEYIKIVDSSPNSIYDTLLDIKSNYVDPEEFDAVVLIELVDLCNFAREMDTNHIPQNLIEELMYVPVCNAINNVLTRDRMVANFRTSLKEHLRTFGPKLNARMIAEFYDYYRDDLGAYGFIVNLALIESFEFNAGILSSMNADRSTSPGKGIRQSIERLEPILLGSESFRLDYPILKKPLEIILDWIEKEGPQTGGRVSALYYMLSTYFPQSVVNPIVLRHLGIENPNVSQLQRSTHILTMFEDILNSK